MGASPLEDATGRRSAAILIRGERRYSNFSRKSRQISLGETMSNKDTPKHSEKGREAGLGTRSVWAGENGEPWERATQVPVALSVSYGYDDLNEWAAVAQGKARGHIYGRNTNPTVAAFEEKVRILEGAFDVAKSFPFQPGDALDRSCMRNAQPAGDVGRARFAAAGQEIVDQFDVIFEHRAGLRQTRFLEALRPLRLGWQFNRGNIRRASPVSSSSSAHPLPGPATLRLLPPRFSRLMPKKTPTLTLPSSTSRDMSK